MELKSRIILCKLQIMIVLIVMNARDMLILSYKRWFTETTKHEKLYKVGMSISSLLVIPLIGVMVDTQRDYFPYVYLFLSIVSISCLFCTIGFVYEAKIFLKTTLQRPIGKWILTGLITLTAALATFVSSLFASKLVNLIVGGNPSELSFALTAITAMLTPFTWIAIFIIIFFVFYISSFIYILLIYLLSMTGISFIIFSIQDSKFYRFLFQRKASSHFQPPILSWKTERVFARTLDCVTLLTSLSSPFIFPTSFPFNIIFQNSLSIDKFLTQVIVITNFYPSSSCKTSKKYVLGKTYAFIGDGMIIEAVPNKDRGYTFEPPRKCNQEKK